MPDRKHRNRNRNRKKNKTFWSSRWRLRRSYDHAYVYDFWFSPGFNVATTITIKNAITITTLVSTSL